MAAGKFTHAVVLSPRARAAHKPAPTSLDRLSAIDDKPNQARCRYRTAHPRTQAGEGDRGCDG
jgi:hypothetical protein